MKPLDLAAWCAALFLAANLFPHTVALRLTLLVLGLAFVGLALARAKRPLDLELLPPLLIPILLWAAWAALSITWSVEPERSMKEYKNEVVYVFLGYWLCWIAAQAPGARRAFGIALGIGAALASVLGLYAHLVPTGHPSVLRFASGPGDQSSALLTLMPLAVIAIWLSGVERMRGAVRWTYWGLPFLFLAAAYATLNRTVWFGFAVQFLVIGALMLTQPEFSSLLKLRRAKVLGGLAAMAFVGGLAVVVSHVQERREGTNLETAVASDPRIRIWTTAADALREHPLTGLGFGRGIERESLDEALKNPLFWHAHNLILETAVDTGLIGAALLLLLIGMTAHRGLSLARDENVQIIAYGVALVAVVAGMLVRNMTDTLLVRQNALLYWGVAALLLGFGEAARRRR